MFFTNLFESNLKTKYIAQEIIYYTSIDSTNDELWSLCKKTINGSSKFIVITDNQKKEEAEEITNGFQNLGKA